MPPPSDAPRPGLTRAGVVEAARELVQQEGLDALAMRALADRLGVKPASLYWHVRDRAELMDLLAGVILAAVPAHAAGQGWREGVRTACATLGAVVAAQRDGARIVLEVPASLERSAVHEGMAGLLVQAGLDAASAREAATMIVAFVLVGPQTAPDSEVAGTGDLRRIAIDSGSRGVVLRSGGVIPALVRAAGDPAAPPPGVIHGDTIVVRRLRGGRGGELELSSAHPWTFRVQGGTWRTTLDLGGLDVRGIHLDGGAARVECTLPMPRGVVPIHVSGGAFRIAFHRPAGAAVLVRLSGGATKVRLDGLAVGVSVGDMQWESPGGGVAPDRYELHISGGAAAVSMDATAAVADVPPAVVAAEGARTRGAVDLLLDGIARAGT